MLAQFLMFHGRFKTLPYALLARPIFFVFEILHMFDTPTGLVLVTVYLLLSIGQLFFY